MKIAKLKDPFKFVFYNGANENEIEEFMNQNGYDVKINKEQSYLDIEFKEESDNFYDFNIYMFKNYFLIYHKMLGNTNIIFHEDYDFCCGSFARLNEDDMIRYFGEYFEEE